MHAVSKGNINCLILFINEKKLIIDGNKIDSSEGNEQNINYFSLLMHRQKIIIM